jgi:CBS domain-containing protein
MLVRRVGAAVVDPDGEGIGILTEHDVLLRGSGQDADAGDRET